MSDATIPTLAPQPESERTFTPADRLAMYRQMLLARTMDERCLTLQRQGRIGFYVPMRGQEAAQVGAAWAIDPTDWIFPAYRELGVALVRGIPVVSILNQFYGNRDDLAKGRQMPNHFAFREFNYVSISSPIGTQITHAVGAAMAAQRRGDRIATITFFGDGATSANDFHAGLNFAGVFRAPTIFFCQNNQWAISLPRERQTRSKTLAEKGAAYGIPGLVVDGTDVDAVYRAVRSARARAISGDGPTLIEAQVYRMGPHSTSDDPRRYRTEQELKSWEERDPIQRFRASLLANGLLTSAQDQALSEEVKAEFQSALKAAESLPGPAPDSFFEDVYATLPAALEEERREFGALPPPSGGHP